MESSNNVLKHLQARKLGGPVTMPTEIYSKFSCHRRIMGHLSSAYCVCFDQTGQYIFTGADDHLIKIWSARDGRLLKTLRGHDGQISDMCVNYENRLLASAGMDKIIRIWDLRTTKLLECLSAHSATVTSVKFAPYNRQINEKKERKKRYMISTSNDGSVVFWSYDVDTLQFKKYRKFQERNRPGGQIACSCFSTGGSFLACGSSDNFVHVYGFHPDFGPYPLGELDKHQDKVDSVQFCNNGLRFISGSKDGTAIIWTYKGGSWCPLKLDMTTQLEGDQPVTLSNNRLRPTVLIVQWSRDDRYVMTSIVDYSIKVWDSKTGRLVHVLKEHKHDVYLLESHPTDPRIFVSASHDGTMIIWDIERGKVLNKLHNFGESLDGNPAIAPYYSSIFDIKFSPDGSMIATTDMHGFLGFYGMGSAEPYKKVPDQMFFHTDYRALIRDVRQFVMDEQTHLAPHLMPKPTLVDMNGSPYPQYLQSLVPDYKDYKDRNVIPPLSQAQMTSISELIENHSRAEDEDFLKENRSPPDDLNRSGGYMDEDGQSNDGSRFNRRYSTRSSFRSARNTFQSSGPRRTRRQRVNYIEAHQDEDEDDGPWRPPISYRNRNRNRARRTSSRRNLRPRSVHNPRRQEASHRNETHSDSSTEEDTEIDESETEIDGETDASTIIDGADSSTEVDSDATEIDDNHIPNHLRSFQYGTRQMARRSTRYQNNSNTLNRQRESSRPVRRCSLRIQGRKRMRRS